MSSRDSLTFTSPSTSSCSLSTSLFISFFSHCQTVLSSSLLLWISSNEVLTFSDISLYTCSTSGTIDSYSRNPPTSGKAPKSGLGNAGACTKSTKCTKELKKQKLKFLTFDEDIVCCLIVRDHNYWRYQVASLRVLSALDLKPSLSK
jgi:hypothetical protein